VQPLRVVEWGEELVLQLQMRGIGVVDERTTLGCELDDTAARIIRPLAAGDETGHLEPVDALRRRTRGDHGVLSDVSLRQSERRTRSAERAEHVEFALAQPEPTIVLDQLPRELVRDPAHSTDHRHGARVEVRTLATPLLNECPHAILTAHAAILVSVERIMVSVETETRVSGLWCRVRWPLVAAIGPIAFGSNYFVTHDFLPADSPLWGSAIRALPAGLVLLLVARRLPRGAWWWRSVVLGTLNMGMFFCLVYVAAQLLPSSIAASLMSLSPIVIAAAAWLLIHERPAPRVILGAAVGGVGVLLIVGTATGTLDGWGIAASIASMILSSIGAILTKRWQDGTPVLTVTAWQLVVGGLELLAASAIVEGVPPTITPVETLAFVYVSLVATALGFVCWFSGFRHLPAGVVGVIGLLNPVTGVMLGVFLGGEILTPLQIVGILLVLASITIVNTRRRNPRRRPPAGGPSARRSDRSQLQD